jgi:hypothetical protein
VGFPSECLGPFKQFSVTELFSELVMSELRSKIVKADGSVLEQVLESFRVGFVHLSLNAAMMHDHSTLNFILLRTDPRKEDFDFVWYESDEVTKGSLDFSVFMTSDVIKSLSAWYIQVSSIVGDGFSSHLNALSPRSPNSIQNSSDMHIECPVIGRVLYVCCCCHLANLALDK